MTPLDPFGARRRQLVAGSGAIALGGLLGAPALWAQANAAYEPQRGQSGKDVIWIPTPDALITRMLRMAQLTPKDYLIDLGSGDGKIVIAAAREGAQGLGIEYNPDMVELSRRRAKEALVADRARFEKADIFESDFSRATVITMYLLPHLNLRLRHRILALKPGTRVVSHEFRMGRWQPDETARVGTASVHLWLVPANAGGEWTLSFPQGGQPVSLPLKLHQSFQLLRGQVGYTDFEAQLREARVAGEQVSFGFTDELGHLRRFVGRLEGDSISGSVYDFSAGGARAPFSARRREAPPPFDGAAPAPENEAESLGAE
jgi:SAM-dependent methyltransferase